MFDYSASELQEINTHLEPVLARAKTHVAETEQLVMDATRLLTAREEQLDDYKQQPFFKRLWQRLGNSNNNGDIALANTADLMQMQKVGWRYINILNERDLMLASSMITVKNNLISLAVSSEETRTEITRMANKIADRFEQLEDRMRHVEVQTNIHGWLLTLESRDYNEKYSPMLRMLKVGQDFMQLKSGDWNVNEIRYLQQAIKTVELDWKRPIKISEFVNELIDEIEQHQFSVFQKLITLNDTNTQAPIPNRFVLNNISAASCKAMCAIAEHHTNSSSVIDVLAEQLDISRAEALKKVLLKFIKKEGVDTEITIPLRDLAVELLTCNGLAQRLYAADDGQNTNSTFPSIHEKQIDHNEITNAEKLYLNDINEFLADDGIIDEKEKRLLERSRVRLGISEQRGSELEKSVNIPVIKITSDEQLYLNDIVEYFSDDGVIDEKERRLLERERVRLGISEQRGLELEKSVAQDSSIGALDISFLKDVRTSECDQVIEFIEKNKGHFLEIKLRADKGDALAQYFVAECLASGIGIAENSEEAFLYWMKAAEQGHAQSQFSVGNSYYYGDGVEENPEKAFSYYKKAAEQGDAEAQYQVGCFYYYGITIAANIDRAKFWFEKSVNQGHIKAIAPYVFLLHRKTYNDATEAIYINDGYADHTKYLDRAKEYYANEYADDYLIIKGTPNDSCDFSKGYVLTKQMIFISTSSCGAIDLLNASDTAIRSALEWKISINEKNQILDIVFLVKAAQRALTKFFIVGSTGPGGGIVFYVDSSREHGLEAKRADEYGQFRWSGAIAVVKAQGDSWRLPTSNELELLYRHKNIAGGFVSGFYWSSTEIGSDYVYTQDFTNGDWDDYSKNDVFRVRAVRAF